MQRQRERERDDLGLVSLKTSQELKWKAAYIRCRVHTTSRKIATHQNEANNIGVRKDGRGMIVLASLRLGPLSSVRDTANAMQPVLKLL